MSSKLAVQMYAAREHMKTAKDLAATLHWIREIGCTAVQMSAVGVMNGDASEVDVVPAREMLDRCFSRRGSPADREVESSGHSLCASQRSASEISIGMESLLLVEQQESTGMPSSRTGFFGARLTA
jgi:hypothetical protein